MQDNRKFIVWGTSTAGRRLIEKYGDLLCIAHVVDGNIRKKGQEFFGYEIASPDDIKDWWEYRVVIASSYYDEIKCFLEEKSLIEHRDFWNYNNVVNFYTMQDLLKQIDTFLDKIREIGMTDQPRRLLLGNLAGDHQKNIACWLNRMSKIDKEHQWIFLSEDPFGANEEWFDSMQILSLPCLFMHKQQKENITEEEITRRPIDEELHNAALAMQLMGRDMTIAYADEIMGRLYDVYCQILEILKPDSVYVWNGLHFFHRVFTKACRDTKTTEVFYVENGILPGTIVCERHGQLGESDPAVFYKEFQQTEVMEEEREHAKQVIDFLRESGLNRYKQKKDVKFMNILQNRFLPGRPVILFAGQLDFNTGMIPHNEWAVRYHSPIFEMSEAAAVYLRKIAEKREWNLIFKPHPSFPSVLASDDRGFQCVNGGNINEIIDICDLVITIASTVSYIALIRNKPVLMLGYTQLRQKGCTYEAFEENEIERRIEEALEKGLQSEMREAFINHVARLEKSYLYDDMTEKEICIGRSFDQVVREGEIL